MAIKTNILIDQGSTFETVIYVTDNYGEAIPLTGYTSSAQMRKHYQSVSKVDFTTSVNESEGAITLSLTAAQTANVTPGRYVYDVEIEKSSVVSRIVEGIVTVTPNVTR